MTSQNVNFLRATREIVKSTLDYHIRYLIELTEAFVFFSPRDICTQHAKVFIRKHFARTFVTMTLRVARIVRTPLHWRKAKVNTGTSRIERLRVTSAGATYDLNNPRVHLFRLDFNVKFIDLFSERGRSARLISTVK